MSYVDNRLDITVIDSVTAAVFNAGNSFCAVNLDASVGEGISIYGIEANIFLTEADRANLLLLECVIWRGTLFRADTTFGAQLPSDAERVLTIRTNLPTERTITRRYETRPFPLEKGSRYSITLVATLSAVAANPITLTLTAMGENAIEKPKADQVLLR